MNSPTPPKAIVPVMTAPTANSHRADPASQPSTNATGTSTTNWIICTTMTVVILAANQRGRPRGVAPKRFSTL